MQQLLKHVVEAHAEAWAIVHAAARSVRLVPQTNCRAPRIRCILQIRSEGWPIREPVYRHLSGRHGARYFSRART